MSVTLRYQYPISTALRPHHPAPKLKMTIVGEIGIVQVQIQALKLRVETAQEKIAKLDGYIASTDKSLLEGGDDAVVKEREDIRKNLHTCTQELKNFVAGTLERDLEKLKEMEQKMQALESRING
ncbi:hypothetical protein BGZ67_007374 [Mortierella alpina]|nr:hypothetical protein BGZ67_007374 [Mortierella alpina]